MKTVLILASNPLLQVQLRHILESERFELISATTGQHGLELARSHHPDLILSAVNLVDMDGYLFLTQVRHQPETAGILVILIGPSVSPTDYRRGMELGANDFLMEPLSPGDLLASVYARFHQRDAIHNRYISALRHAAERLNRLVHYDSLTDLPNHLLFQGRFEQAIQQLLRPDQPIAVLFINLNRLSRVNNLLGYPFGDYLLQVVAIRLQDCLTPSDTLARLTGSQFAVLLAEVSDRQDVIATTELILATLSQPIQSETQEIFLTISIGIAMYPEDGKSITMLVRKADAAMHQAKQKKGHHYQFYQTQMDLISDNVLNLETQLQYALRRGEFQICYQPQVNIKTRNIEGVEALIRWRHPHQGLISPAEFIPLAEETGLIVPIGTWVLQMACQQAKQWQNRSQPLFLRMSVNISGYQFNEPDFTDLVAQILAETKLDPRYLELELTETTLMQDLEQTTGVLNALKALGIRLAIDDFGTGYSSLSYIKRFPVDALKLDHCFVRNIWEDPTNIAITTAVIQMAHDLNLSVIAEGVETDAEWSFLDQQNCDTVQGYLMSPPLSVDEIERFVASLGC